MRTWQTISALALLFALTATPRTGSPVQADAADPANRADHVGKPAATAAESMVKLWVLAEGRGKKLVLDLTASDFQLLDEGRPQPVTYFARRPPEPISLGILIETSRSELYEPDPAGWRPYSDLLHKVLRPGDQAFVASFAEKAQLHGDFTGDLAKLDSALQDVFAETPEGTPGLYDSIYTLAEERFAGQPGHRALLVVSDSPDTYSYHNQLQTLEQIERRDVTVYSLLPWVDRGGQPPFGGIEAAQYFAKQTGGLFYLALNPKVLQREIDGIAAALTYTYTLGFAPTGPSDGRYHAVRLKCSRPGVKLHVSQGYYADGR
ncbi:MAG TPA: VWA domain-containing protein [Terriglobia bacterium]